MDNLETWKLADEVSVIDATFLLIGLNPSKYRLESPLFPSESKIIVVSSSEGQELNNDDFDYCEQQGQNQDFERIFFKKVPDFNTVFKGLRTAILRNKLSANFGFPARARAYKFWNDQPQEILDPTEEVDISCEMLLSSQSNFPQVLTAGVGGSAGVGKFPDFVIRREPDWSETYVEVDALRNWLRERNYHSDFFGTIKAEYGVMNEWDDRYSPKLAAALAAWESVKQPAPNRSVKQTISDWLTNNASRFGMADSAGLVSATAIEEVSKVVNWDQKGGATKTSSPQPKTAPEQIQNFSTEKIEIEGDFDDEIPF